MLRHHMKAGMTGWAQVNGLRLGVVSNEFGALGIDAALLGDGEHGGQVANPGVVGDQGDLGVIDLGAGGLEAAVVNVLSPGDRVRVTLHEGELACEVRSRNT